MTELIIYGYMQSTFVRSACMAAVEKGITYALEPIELGSEGYRKLHPWGKMPSMRHGDLLIYETLAIGHYIDQAFDGPALMPNEPATNARMHSWCSAVIDYLAPHIAVGILQPKAGFRDVTDAELARSVELAAYDLHIVETSLTNDPFLAGDRLSFADLMVVPLVAYLSNTPPEGTDLLNAVPGVRAWLDQMATRPSFQDTTPPPFG
ncbi:MAG: glutathione S-transferase family protein [Geminicoccaceae bacterium]